MSENTTSADPTWNDMFGTWVVTGYDSNRQVLRDADYLNDPRNVGFARDSRDIATRKNRAPALQQLDDPEHRRLRALVASAFSLNEINALRPRIEQTTADTIERFVDRSTFDAIADFAEPIATQVVGAFLGINPAERGQFREWTQALSKQLQDTVSAADLTEIEAAEAALRAYALELVRSRGRQRQDDLISRLIEAREDDDRLSEEEILSLVQLLILAGTGTTADLIGNGLFALLRHPEQCEALRSMPSLIENAVEEILRYDTPVQIVSRYAGADKQLNGVQIEQTSLVTAAIAAANHDSAANPKPSKFDISRRRIRHLAFGAGIHHCLGASLARVTAQIAIIALLEAFPKLRLGPDKVRRKPIARFRGCAQLVLLAR